MQTRVVGVDVGSVPRGRFGLDRDGTVLVRTSAASEPARAIDGAVVAFEADEVDTAASPAGASSSPATPPS